MKYIPNLLGIFRIHKNQKTQVLNSIHAKLETDKLRNEFAEYDITDTPINWAPANPGPIDLLKISDLLNYPAAFIPGTTIAIIATGEGNGPVNAIDKALRSGLEKIYPELSKLELTDYKVRILEGRLGTGAVTRVLVETSDGETQWNTVGVH